ncbi:MAG: flavin reductase [Acidimicrobiales bacterium]|nr:flavin reductase [Acidimicrobiales bacterium]MCB9373702.1 flavin reductase [Microthrixaceae bacterium]
MIDQGLKRSLGQMMKGVQVVGAVHDGVARAYCSHWVCQVSFEEPILLASVSPKHDTHPLIVGSGRFTVSVLAADQVDAAQYFSYPGRKFRHIAEEWVAVDGPRVLVPDSIAWLQCEVLDRVQELPGAGALDHDLFFARVTDAEAGRLGEPPLLYSSRLGWRATGDKARPPGVSIRDALLARLDEREAPDRGARAAGEDEP